MKYLCLIVVITLIATIAGQKDPANVAAECKGKFPITTVEEEDIQTKKFASTSNNSKSFFNCFCTGTGFADSKGQLNRTAFIATANNDTALITKIDSCLKACNISKSTDPKTVNWENGKCYFDKIAKA